MGGFRYPPNGRTGHFVSRGHSFYYSGTSNLTGVRISAPPLDPRKYHDVQKWKKNNPDQEPPTEEENEKERAKSKKRREGRAQSTRRYAHFRETRGRSHVNDDHRKGNRYFTPLTKNFTLKVSNRPHLHLEESGAE